MRRYLRAANVGWAGLLLNDVKSMNFTDAEMDTFRLEPGDILLNEASGSPNEVGKPAIWNGELEDCAFQNTLLRVRSGPSVDPQYLLHYFRHQAATAAFARGSRGVGINHLGREALASWPVPLPSVDEQHRIAAVLDRADSLRSIRGEVIERFTDLSESIHQRMSLKSTITVKLGDLCEVKGGKRLPKGAPYAPRPTSHPYIRVSDMRYGRIDLADLKFIDDEVHSAISRYVVGPEDVVISIAGSIGHTAAVPAELIGANLTENAARITPRADIDRGGSPPHCGHPLWRPKSAATSGR